MTAIADARQRYGIPADKGNVLMHDTGDCLRAFPDLRDPIKLNSNVRSTGMKEEKFLDLMDKFATDHGFAQQADAYLFLPFDKVTADASSTERLYISLRLRKGEITEEVIKYCGRNVAFGPIDTDDFVETVEGRVIDSLEGDIAEVFRRAALKLADYRKEWYEANMAGLDNKFYSNQLHEEGRYEYKIFLNNQGVHLDHVEVAHHSPAPMSLDDIQEVTGQYTALGGHFESIKTVLTAPEEVARERLGLDGKQATVSPLSIEIRTSPVKGTDKLDHDVRLSSHSYREKPEDKADKTTGLDEDMELMDEMHRLLTGKGMDF